MIPTNVRLTSTRSYPETQVQTSFSMSSLIRWCGLAGIVAGALFALETLLHPARDINTLADSMQQSVLGVSWTVSHTFAVLYCIVIPFALMGWYAVMMNRAGRLGLVGFTLSIVGNALLLGVTAPDAYIFPAVAANPTTRLLLDLNGPILRGPMGIFLIVSGLVLVVGTVMLCIAGIRARVLPARAFLLVGIGIPLTTFGPLAANILGLIGATLGGIGYMALGYALWTKEAQS